MRPACAIAALERLALRVQLLGEVEQHDAVLHDEADEQDEPHRRRDVQVGAGQPQQQQRAAERERRREQDQDRRQPRPELDDEDHEHQHDRQREDHQQLAERLRLRLILPADLVGVADRQLERVEVRADLGDRASEIAPFEPSADDRHRAQVLAPQLALPVRALPSSRPRTPGIGLPSARADQRVGKLVRDRSGTSRAAGRERESCDPASRRSVATSPSQLPAI